MAVFKTYDGQNIEIPTHKHSVTDTKRSGATAYATLYEDGFMMKEDRVRLTNLKTKMDFLNDRMQSAVYLAAPKFATLLSGSDFNTKLNSLGPNATSVVFTNTVIPSDKIDTAEIVSTDNSRYKAYMYLDGEILYISPEEDDIIIQGNEDCSNMFSLLTNLTSLDFSNFDTSNVTNMSSMFMGSPLTSLDLSNFDTSNVITMQYMFSSCSSLTSLDLSNWNTSSVIDMGNMFPYCQSLTSLDLSSFNTSNVRYMSFMFYHCSSLINIDGLSNFDTSKITNMGNMFNNCPNLISLDLSSFDTSNVTGMNNMFNDCSSLINIDGLSNWDTSKVTNMTGMFNNCPNLISSITIMNPNITSYLSMFTNCSTEERTEFIVNYIDDATKNIATQMVATKSDNSNVHLFYTEQILNINNVYGGGNNLFINKNDATSAVVKVSPGFSMFNGQLTVVLQDNTIIGQTYRIIVEIMDFSHNTTFYYNMSGDNAGAGSGTWSFSGIVYTLEFTATESINTLTLFSAGFYIMASNITSEINIAKIKVYTLA